MVDFYTKAVLTVIALALTVIAASNFTPRSGAQSSSCGAQYQPCYVTNSTIDGAYPLTVKVRN